MWRMSLTSSAFMGERKKKYEFLELLQLQYRSCAVCNIALDNQSIALDSLAFNVNLKQFISFGVSSEVAKVDKNYT